MTFGSPGFLFVFMPIVFALYYLAPPAWRNRLLMAASLGFYAVDAGMVSVVLLGSVIANHVIGKQIDRMGRGPACHALLVFGVVLNLVPLLYYKYWNFLAGAFGDAARQVGMAAPISAVDVVLPVGISFFTFQGLSYLVDIWRREVRPAARFTDFGMYHTLFPQLIAGPIVRYGELEDRIVSRPILLEDVAGGLMRFSIGLAKKIILADTVGVVADRMFDLPADQLGVAAAWVGIIAYTLQIFFDFSGYSDMAIGMGRMLGFRFPENFDQPYRSRSITEFWRRWHMTLSRWFRDYLYIPLGGNRAGPWRTYANLLAVFVLCGLWHGAAYGFLLWGLFHGVLLMIERAVRTLTGAGPSGLAGWALTLLLVMIGWVLFRAPSAVAAGQYLAAMAGMGQGVTPAEVWAVLTADHVTYLLVATVLALLPAGCLTAVAGRFRGGFVLGLQSLGALALVAMSAVMIAANGFNPFIYFRF